MRWQSKEKWGGWKGSSNAVAAAALVLLAACSGEPTRPDDDGGTDGGHDGGFVPGPGDGGIAVQYGGANFDEFLDVVVDSAGVYVAGYRNGVRGRFDPSGDSAGIVRGYSRANGELLWETRYDLENATEIADALALDGETLLVAGRTSGSYGGFVNAGQTDLFVSRLHTGGGTVTPLLQFGDERPQHPARIALDGRGDVIVAGLNDGFIEVNYVVAWEDTLLARVSYDAATNTFAKQSLVRSETERPDVFYGLAAIGDEGDAIVSGMEFSGPSRGPFVRRVSADAGVVWSRTLTGVSFDSAMAVAVGPDGHVYVAGSTFGQFGERTYGQQDAFVAVLDGASGQVLRGMQAGSSDSDWVRDLEVDADGNVWVAGSTLGALPGFGQRGGSDAFVVVFDASGRWVASWQHGSSAFDETSALALDELGNAYVAGMTEGNFIPGQTYGGGRDAFLLQIPGDAFVGASSAGQ